MKVKMPVNLLLTFSLEKNFDLSVKKITNKVRLNNTKLGINLEYRNLLVGHQELTKRIKKFKKMANFFPLVTQILILTTLLYILKCPMNLKNCQLRLIVVKENLNYPLL